MLTFHAPLTEKPYEDTVDDKTISSSLEPSIVEKYGVSWSEFESGTNDHVLISSSDGIELFGDEFTVGFWVEFHPQASVSELFSWSVDGSDRAFTIQRLGNATVVFRTYQAGGGTQVKVTTPEVANVGRPMFISASYSSIRELKLQAGGKFSETAIRPTSLGTCTGNVIVGRRPTTGNQHFGLLRDWQVWDEVLSDEERLQIHRSGLWFDVTSRQLIRGRRSSRDSKRTVSNPGLR